MDITALLKEIKTEIVSLVKDRFNKESKAITNEITLFLNQSKTKLERWTSLLAQGEITPAEFEILLQSQKDLIEMKALHKAGITGIQLGHFKNTVIKLIFNKITLFIGI